MDFSVLSQRAYSYKTRIKTRRRLLLINQSYDTQRAYSYKTRIKTVPFMSIEPQVNPLKEHIPIKQGLRLFITYSVCVK